MNQFYSFNSIISVDGDTSVLRLNFHDEEQMSVEIKEKGVYRSGVELTPPMARVIAMKLMRWADGEEVTDG